MNSNQLSIIQFISVLGIGLMLVGGLGMLLMSTRNRRAVGVFMLGSVIVLLSAFFENPNMISEAQFSITKALVGLIGTIIATIKIKISNRKK